MQRLSALDPLYYLRNFESALTELERRDEDLLDVDEQAFISTFRALPEISRALLTRLVMRGVALIRCDSLKYPEIEPLEEAAAPLLHLGWVSARPPLDLQQLLALFTKAELCRALRLPRAWLNHPKSLLRRMLAEHRAAEALQSAAPLAEQVWQLAIKAQCDVVRALYFGNFRQGWEEIVLAELKVRRFEQVASAGRPFETLDQVRAFKALGRCQELLDLHTPAPIIEALLPSAIAGCDWLEERRHDYLLAVARLYERQGSPECALRLYALSERDEARRRERVLQPGRSRVRARGPDFGSIPVFDALLARAAHGRGIEQAVGRQLLVEAPESSVYYVENSLICSLFALLCWRAIFAPVRGAFFHRFHRAPADLASRSFYSRRRGLFEECLGELASLRYRDTIMDAFARKRGVSCALIAWGALRRPLIERSLDCIPPDHLALYFNYLLLDMRENRAGFPDLIQFWPNRAYRLIEVKSPTDRLQPSQRRCLEYLHAHGLPVSICRPRILVDTKVPSHPAARRTLTARARRAPRCVPEPQMSFSFS